MSSTLALPERYEAPTVGDRLGPYEILGRLGRGGMGLVFRAWDGRLHREVAIKLLHHEYPVPGSRERFMREARAASALNHPNICTIFDIGDREGAKDDAPYLVMELLRGETLKARIERGVLGVDEIVRCGMQVADALGAAHARGIVHRDIKPANIFLVERADGGRQAKVLDFGLAQTGESGGSRPGSSLPRLGASNRADISGGMTRDGATVGTVAYMSPEQARGDALDGRADLFSLGVVMYEMATRRVPFYGSTTELAFERLMRREPEAIRDWNDAIPRGLEKIILQLLAKEPEGRFQTAAEVSLALAGLVAKGRGGRLRRVSPAIPLVKVKEPMARKGLPVREQRLIDLGRIGLAAAADGVSAVETPIGVAEADSPGIDSRSDEEFVVEGADVETVSPGGLARRRRRRLWFGVTLAATALGLAFVGPGQILRAPVMGAGDRLMIGAIENHTADQTLDGTLERGLEIVLAESPNLVVDSGNVYWGYRRQAGGNGGGATTAVQARQAAQANGAKVYLYGAVTENQGAGRRDTGYMLSVKALDAVTNRELAVAAVPAEGREQLLRAVDRVAAELREKLGFDGGENTGVRGSVAQFEVPLSQEATGNIDALHWYSVGMLAELDGRRDAAVRAYGSAIQLDPGFVQAQTRLASNDGEIHSSRPR